MEILYLLIPLSVVLVFLIAVIFWWSVRSGQFEDLEGPAYRMLMDDDKAGAAPPVAETTHKAGNNAANNATLDPDQGSGSPAP